MIKPPCKDKDGNDCPNRSVGCHSRCERYSAFRTEKDKERKHEQSSVVSALYAVDTVYRARKSIKRPSTAQRRLLGQR